MLTKFTKHIQSHFSFLQKEKFYIAVSGGIDSMVLLHLFQHFQFSFGVLHCNFKLRGEESDADMRFIHDYCEENNMQLRIGFFETERIAKELKESIQVTARNLRYNWFYEQLEENDVKFVVTAHHLDDQVETFLIHFARGTGLEGLTGIPAQNGAVIRPLLPFSRTEIENYAHENNIKWCEDSSNASTKYLRNKLRHNVVPVFKDINEGFLEAFQNTLAHLQQAQGLVNDATKFVYAKVVTKNKHEIKIDVSKLLQYEHYKSYLYQWLKEYNFSSWEDIYNLVSAQSGKQVFSATHIILKDREHLLVFPKTEKSCVQEYFLSKNQENLKIPLNVSLSKVDNISVTTNNVIFVDEDKVQFPLTIRKKQEGDFFYPSGMHGKKKLSKYFKDEKYSLIDKENQWLLTSKNEIVWVIGKRADQRFLANESTRNCLKIEITE